MTTTHEDKRYSEISERKKDFYKKSAASRKGWQTKRKNAEAEKKRIKMEESLKKKRVEERKEKIEIMRIAEKNASQKQKLFEKRKRW